MCSSTQKTQAKGIGDKAVKKNLRVLCPMLYPLGGIRTYLHYNYPVLQEAGYRFTFIAPEGEDFEILQKELGGWYGAEFVASKARGRKCDLGATVRKVLKKGRHSLIHSQGVTAGISAIFGNLGIGVPHVITSHDVFRPNQFQGLSGQLKRILLEFILCRATALITVSQDAEHNHLEYLPALRRGPCQVVTIINGIDTSRFPTDSEPWGLLRKKLQIDSEVFLIGFMGRFMEQKGFLTLIDAIDRVLERGTERSFHLVAVGSGDYIREYKQYVNTKPEVSKRVTFMDRVANSAEVLRELDLLVMPSLWEACPLLPMEAMCMGVPVVGSDCIGLREVLRGTPSLIATAGDSRALAEELLRTIENPITEAARAYAPQARNRFNAAFAAEQLEELLSEKRKF